MHTHPTPTLTWLTELQLKISGSNPDLRYVVHLLMFSCACQFFHGIFGAYVLLGVTERLVLYCLQEGKLSDMKAMIGILKARGRTDNDYFKAQVGAMWVGCVDALTLT